MLEATKQQNDEATKGLAGGMPEFPSSHRRIVAPSHYRKGFSFTEVLFAVIVLGIGFIMVAAIFPVAIQQRQLTSEETSASNIVGGAVNSIKQIATDVTMPVTDVDGGGPGPLQVWAFAPDDIRENTADTTPLLRERWEAIKGQLVLEYDPRYAWIPLYVRNVGESFAQVIVVAAEVRNTGLFGPWDLENDATNRLDPVNLAPRRATVEIVDSVDGDLVIFETDAASPNTESHITGLNGIAEGSVVVIAADDITTLNVNEAGMIFRVGMRRTELNGTGPDTRVWELAPGSDTSVSIPAGTPAYVIGRAAKQGTLDAGNWQNVEFEGPAMPVSVYVTFVRVN